MSIGLGVLLGSVLIAWLLNARKLPFTLAFRLAPVRGFAISSVLFTSACALSLLGAWFFPMGYSAGTVQVHFLQDMFKAWYLFWPLGIYWLLKALDEKSRSQVLTAWLASFGVLSFL